jgi:hypothetical protein
MIANIFLAVFIVSSVFLIIHCIVTDDGEIIEL